MDQGPGLLEELALNILDPVAEPFGQMQKINAGSRPDMISINGCRLR